MAVVSQMSIMTTDKASGKCVAIEPPNECPIITVFLMSLIDAFTLSMNRSIDISPASPGPGSVTLITRHESNNGIKEDQVAGD